MDFSDIRTIIIGEAGEYGKRLVRYLEIHLSSAVRVYHFTTAEGMVENVKFFCNIFSKKIFNIVYLLFIIYNDII